MSRERQWKGLDESSHKWDMCNEQMWSLWWTVICIKGLFFYYVTRNNFVLNESGKRIFFCFVWWLQKLEIVQQNTDVTYEQPNKILIILIIFNSFNYDQTSCQVPSRYHQNIHLKSFSLNTIRVLIWFAFWSKTDPDFCPISLSDQQLNHDKTRWFLLNKNFPSQIYEPCRNDSKGKSHRRKIRRNDKEIFKFS